MPTSIVPFDQEYVPPPVAVTLIEVVAQVNIVATGVLIPADTAISWVITMLSVSVQPLAPVTVTV